jgi:hypothetical protein
MDPILVSQILKDRRKRARLANPRLNQSYYFKKWYAKNRDKPQAQLKSQNNTFINHNL